LNGKTSGIIIKGAGRMSEKDIEKMKQFLEEKKKQAKGSVQAHPGKTHGKHLNSKGFHNLKSGGSLNK
jgi:hypothetical protein